MRKADRPDKGSVGAVGGTILKGMGMKEAYFSGNSGPIGRDIRRYMPADPKGLAAQVARNVNDDIADSIGLSTPTGAMVTKVTEDGPASKEDIKAGDVIVGVNGDEVKDSRDLARKIAELEPDAGMDAETLQVGFREIDTDHDRRIDRAEFMAWWLER